MKRCWFIVFLLIAPIILAQVQDNQLSTSQKVIDKLTRAETLLTKVVEDLSLIKRPCHLNQFRLFWGLNVGFCADSKLDFEAFKNQLESSLISADRGFVAENTGLIINWQHALDGDYYMGSVVQNLEVYSFIYIPRTDSTAFAILSYGLPGVSSDSVSDPNVLFDYLDRHNLSTVKAFMPPVIEIFWYYFDATEVECQSISEFLEAIDVVPFCGTTTLTLDEFKLGMADFAKELSWVLRFSEEHNEVALTESFYRPLNDGVYLPFYFYLPKYEYRYFLRFVERDDVSMIVIYPPKFE
jgi:hypothetical protein